MPATIPMVDKFERAGSNAALPDDRLQATEPSEAPGHETKTDKRLPQALPGVKSDHQVGLTLGVSFGILIAILLGAAYLTMDRMQRMNASTEETLNEGLLELQLGQEGLRYSSENSRITMQLFLVQQPEVIEQLLARRAENTRKITAVLRALEPHCESPQKKRLLEEVKETRKAYLDSYQQALHLLLTEKKAAAATAVMVQQTTPALFRYHAAWDEFLRFEKEQVELASERSKQQYATARHVMLAFILIAGLLAAAIAMVATRKVANLIKSRIRVQTEVNRLNTELEQRVAQRTRDLMGTQLQLQSSLAELRDYTSKVEAVNQFVELLQSCLTLQEAYQQSALVLEHLFPAGTLLMLNPSRNLLDVAASWGAAFSRPGPFQPDSCWALRKGRAHAAQPGNFGLLCGHVDAAAAAYHFCVPMVAQGESLGALSVTTPVPCDPAGDAHSLHQSQELAINLAEHLSLAFANLMLRETLKYQAVRDPLTGLFNRRHMEEALGRDLLRAARNQKPVAVLMADIDHFKQFNDAFGHEAGDVLLRDLGSLLSSEVRGGDFACRYGGEEFLLILSDTDLQVASERAKKLNEQVRNMHVRHRGQMLRSIALSIGVAGFPQHGTTSAQIITAADQALYKAKAAGRDRVMVADDEVLLLV